MVDGVKFFGSSICSLALVGQECRRGQNRVRTGLCHQRDASATTPVPGACYCRGITLPEPAMPMNRLQCQPAAAMPTFFALNGSEAPCASALLAICWLTHGCPRFGFLEHHQVGHCERQRFQVSGSRSVPPAVDFSDRWHGYWRHPSGFLGFYRFSFDVTGLCLRPTQ